MGQRQVIGGFVQVPSSGGGGGSDTPWTLDHDAGGFALSGLLALASPSSTFALNADGSGILANSNISWDTQGNWFTAKAITIGGNDIVLNPDGSGLLGNNGISWDGSGVLAVQTLNVGGNLFADSITIGIGYSIDSGGIRFPDTSLFADASGNVFFEGTFQSANSGHTFFDDNGLGDDLALQGHALKVQSAGDAVIALGLSTLIGTNNSGEPYLQDVNGATFGVLGGSPGFAYYGSHNFFDTDGFLYGDASRVTGLGVQLTDDTGWVPNADAGDKTAVIPSAATLATIATAMNLAVAGSGDALVAIAAKSKAYQTALVANLLPNA